MKAEDGFFEPTRRGRRLARAAGWTCIVLSIGVLAVGIAVGLSPITVEGGTCGSAWLMAAHPSGDCYHYFHIVMWIAVGIVLVGLVIGVAGAALVRKRTQLLEPTGSHPGLP